MELNRLARANALALAFALAIVPADAQRYQDSTGTIVPGAVPIQPGVGPLFTTANPGKVSGSFTATILGFSPTPGAGGLAQILFSDASSHNVALPSGSDFKVENTSANPAYCVASTSGSTAATSANESVPASSTRAFHGVNGSTTYTNLACISPLSTLSITIVGGTGPAADSGGGGGGVQGIAGGVPFPVKPGTVTPLGDCQLSVGASAVPTSSCPGGGIPTGTTYALVCNEGTAVRWRDNGAAPTSSLGQILGTGTVTSPVCTGFVTTFSSLQFIAESGTTVLDVNFYR